MYYGFRYKITATNLVKSAAVRLQLFQLSTMPGNDGHTGT